MTSKEWKELSKKGKVVELSTQMSKREAWELSDCKTIYDLPLEVAETFSDFDGNKYPEKRR